MKLKQKEREKYCDLAKEIIGQIYTEENLKKMDKAIKKKNEFNVQYGRGGIDMARGYYSPSRLEDIIVTNISRGKILSRVSKKSPDYCYYFEGNRLVLVQKYPDDEHLTAYEWIERSGNLEYSISVEEENECNIIVSKFSDERIMENYFLYYDFGGIRFELIQECYQYEEKKLISAVRKTVSMYSQDYYEDEYRFDFIYSDGKEKLKCLIDGEYELRIPPRVKTLITGKQEYESRKLLQEIDITIALQTTISIWNGKDVYAISVFINHDGDEVTDFAVSYNREEGQTGEKRWNYAFWEQDEKSLMYLLDEKETDWKRLLKLTASAVRKLHEKGIFKELFGKDIAVIIHGYEYEEAELEATRKANPNNQAKEFFEALNSLR